MQDGAINLWSAVNASGERTNLCWAVSASEDIGNHQQVQKLTARKFAGIDKRRTVVNSIV